MPKRQVKMLESISGMGDAQPKELALKYEKIEREMRSKIKLDNGRKIRIFTDEQIARSVAEEKQKDGQEPRRGFTRDYAFKAGDTPFVENSVADNWEAAGLCVSLASDPQRKAA
jgi:hypothetical protein